MELWIDVLSRLEANLDPTLVWRQRCLDSCAKEYSKMQTLRLIFSKFNKALDDSHLSRCLFLREAFSTRNLPSLLRWAKRQHTSLQLFACDVGVPTLEAALAAMACSESHLRFADILKVSQAAVDMLSHYSALHSIDLGSGGSSMLDLQPLAALPSLGRLRVAEGIFQGVETLVHLTNLELSYAYVTCPTACVWPSKLLKLRLDNSQLSLQGQGLVACQNLRHLMLRDCVVHANQHNDTLALKPDLAAQIPAGMAALTQLTSLIITFCGQALEDIDFSWLGSLTALQDLGFHAREDLELPAELTDLTNLNNLWVSTADSEDETACMEFQVNWLRMPSLISLFLQSGLYGFDSQLLQIENCTAIKELNFDQVRPASADSAMYFATLMHILAKERPDVACYWGRVHMSDVLEEG